MEETLKAPKDWQAETGIEVLDADGWRGVNGRDFSEPVSEEEFRYRAGFSTIRSTRAVWNESPQEALDAILNADPVDFGEPDSDEVGE